MSVIAVEAKNLKLDTSVPRQATLSWEATATTNLLYWLVEYKTNNIWTKHYILNASTMSLTITGLSGLTNFRVWAVVKQYTKEISSIITAKSVTTNTKVIIGANGASGYGPAIADNLVNLGFRGDRIELGGPGNKVYESSNNNFTNITVIVGNIKDSEKLSSVKIANWANKIIEEIKKEVLLYSHNVCLLECINEPYFKGNLHEPIIYGRMYLALKEELVRNNINIPLGFCSSADYKLPNGNWSQMDDGGGWNADAVKACPELAQKVDCFIFHPYGAPGFTNGEHAGPKGMEEQHDNIVKLGFKNTDVYITEYGRSLDEVNGSEVKQASDIQEVYKRFTELSYVKGIWYYQVHDDSTGKWGLVSSTWTPRPSLNVVASFT